MTMENFEKSNGGEKIQYEKLEDIVFEEVSKGEPGFDSALEINIPEDSDTNIESEAKKKLKNENWWLQEEWQEKGSPKEQVEIDIGGHKITLYNFGEPLEQQHFQELESALRDLSQAVDGRLLSEIKYILMDNVSKQNPQSGENFRGYNLPRISSIRINPEGRQIAPYGRIKGVSNFDAVLIHEFSHNIRKINLDFINKWIKKFWVLEQDFEKKRKMPGGGEDCLDYDPIDPKRCVSEYARSSPDEDLCESMVAALRNPQALDLWKLKLIKKELLGKNKADEVKFERRDKIELPKIKSPVKYKVDRFQFKWENK